MITMRHLCIASMMVWNYSREEAVRVRGVGLVLEGKDGQEGKEGWLTCSS
jgi:hypothetical protein